MHYFIIDKDTSNGDYEAEELKPVKLLYDTPIDRNEKEEYPNINVSCTFCSGPHSWWAVFGDTQTCRELDRDD